MNTLSKNTRSKTTRSKNTLSKNTLSKNTLSKTTRSKNRIRLKNKYNRTRKKPSTKIRKRQIKRGGMHAVEPVIKLCQCNGNGITLPHHVDAPGDDGRLLSMCPVCKGTITSSSSIKKIQTRVEEIQAVDIPPNLSEQTNLWKMAEAREVVDSSIIIRAFGLHDILEDKALISLLYRQYGHLVGGPDGELKITYIMAVMTMKQIADFFGY